MSLPFLLFSLARVSHAHEPSRMARGDWSSKDWEGFLRERLDLDVRVTFGRSRSAPVQARSAPSRSTSGTYVWEIRLHAMFVSTPPEVREALVKWLRVGRRATKAGPVLDRWIHEQVTALPPKVRRINLSPRGDVHDLTALAAPLFAGEFAGEFDGDAAFGAGTGVTGDKKTERPGISWGRRTRSRSRRSLRLGSFEPESRVVRIHPVLDQEAVPAWFVTFVLKHEILHAIIDAYRDESGRWVHHGPEFRRREESWVEYEHAMAWERRNLARLIRSAREGTKLQVRAADLVWPGDPQAPLPEPGGGELRPDRIPVAAKRARTAANERVDKTVDRPEGHKPEQGTLFDC